MKQFVLALLTLVCLSFVGYAQEERTEGALMTFENKDHEFGSIFQGVKTENTFVFKNTGTKPLIISGAQGSCGCTVPRWPKEPIMPGEQGEVYVSFNSEGKYGTQDKTVTINSNATNSPIVLHMKGNVVKNQDKSQGSGELKSPVNQ